VLQPGFWPAGAGLAGALLARGCFAGVAEASEVPVTGRASGAWRDVAGRKGGRTVPSRGPEVSLLDVVFHVQVVGQKGGPAAVRACPAVRPVGSVRPPRAVQWDERRMWPGVLDSLVVSAVEGPGGVLGGWQAAYLGVGSASRRRTEGMTSVLSRLEG
jgi:hypothetical protein